MNLIITDRYDKSRPPISRADPRNPNPKNIRSSRCGYREHRIVSQVRFGFNASGAVTPSGMTTRAVLGPSADYPGSRGVAGIDRWVEFRDRSGGVAAGHRGDPASATRRGFKRGSTSRRRCNPQGRGQLERRYPPPTTQSAPKPAAPPKPVDEIATGDNLLREPKGCRIGATPVAWAKARKEHQ